MEVPEFARAVLERRNFELAGAMISNPAVPNGAFVPIRISRDGAGKQIPSYRELVNLRSELAGDGLDVEFLLIDREAKSIEEGLRASLITSFPDIVRNVFVTVIDGSANIWIDNKRQPTEFESVSITAQVNTYTQISRLNRTTLHFISDEELATNTEILAFIRRLAPLDCDGLSVALTTRGFAVPSLDWINRKFDAMRKAGLVVRLNNRSYVLTSNALHLLGTSKNRHSPDIGRLLALAGRKC